MSDPGQTELPSLNQRFRNAHNDYVEARTAAIDCMNRGTDEDAQVWATLAVAAATVLAEPVPHCSKCCY